MKKLIFTIIITFSIIKNYSQIGNNKIINVKSPEVTDFIRYGNISSSNFNGELNSQIPLLSIPIKQQNNLDIFLAYNSSGFVPSKRSGIVGLNWHLNVGGLITREVNGVPDDQLGQPMTAQAGGNNYIPNGFIAGVKLQKTYTSSTYNNDNIFNNPLSYGFAQDTNPDIYLFGAGNSSYNVNEYEANPDIFSFNFNGISGKFFMGYDGLIKVITNEPNTLIVDVSNMSSQYFYTNDCARNFQSSEIKITDNEGNIYYFGGLSKFLEYTIPMDSPNSGGKKPVITSWYLKKIEYYQTKEIIEFQYKDDSVLLGSGGGFCDINYFQHGYSGPRDLFALTETFNEDYYTYDLDVTQISWGFALPIPVGYWQQTRTQASGSVSGAPSKTYSLQKKAQLIGIIGNDFQVNFNYSYQGYQFNNYQYLSGINSVIREAKLDNISLINLSNNEVKKINFEYSIKGGTVSQNSYPRLFLDKVIEVGKPPYILEYDISSTDLLPRPSSCAIDHWGFWNGKSGNDEGNFHSFTLIPDTQFTPSGDYTFISDHRDPNYNFSSKGQLKKIVYPTGGYSEFQYEQHVYNKRIERRSDNNFLPSLYNVNGIVGGVRIKKILDFDGTVNTNIKEYKYFNNFPSNESSGILLQWPRYTVALRVHLCCGNNGGDKTWAHINSNTINKNIIESSVINYSEVTEVLQGNGYTVNKYSDYISNPDKGLLNSDYKINKIFYTTASGQQGAISYDLPELEKNLNSVFFNDISFERGKLKWQKIYDNSNVLKSEITYLYNEDPLKYNKYVTFTHTSGSWLQTYKQYYYNYFLTQTKSKTYNTVGNIENTQKYTYISAPTYNSTLMSNQDILSETSTTSSINNEIIKTEYKYPWQNYLATSTMFLNFKNANIMYPIREIQYRNAVKLSEKFTLFAKDASTNSLMLPKSIYNAKFPNTFPNITDIGNLEKKFTYDFYDSKGNVSQYTQENGISVTIIWGYNKSQPIAKIENATITQVATALSTTTTVLQTYNENNMTALNGLRSSLPNAMVTTYVHLPLIGVSTITDPKGDISTYTYDANNRLKDVKDKNGNVLTDYQYHYKNQ